MSKYLSYFSRIKLPILVLYLTPLVLLCWFVANFSVNTPFLDQWTLVNLFEKIATGTVTVGDFFAQHLEHRIFFPKIIFSILAFSSKWNIKLEQWCSIFLAIVSFYALYRLSANQRNSSQLLFHLGNIATAMFFFSLVQFGNWLWGFQLAWYLINACVILSVFILIVPKKISPYLRIALAALGCFIASFSAGHGLLSWLALIPTVAFMEANSRQRKVGLILWLLLFVLCCVIYSIGYIKPATSADLLFSLKKPLFAIVFVVMLVGSSSFGLAINPVISGSFIVINFIFLNICYLRKYPSDLFREAVPWLSLGWFSTLVVLMVTVGRVGYGVGNSLQTRYSAGAIFIIISCIQLWRLLVHPKSEDPTRSIRVISVTCFLFGLLTATFISYSTAAIAEGRSLWLRQSTGQTCTEVIYYLDKSFEYLPDSCLELVTSDLFNGLLRNSVQSLDRLGFRSFPKDIAFVTEPNKPYGKIESPSTSEKSLTLPRNLNIKVSGWAALPEGGEQPRVILLSYGNEKSFFTNAVVKLPRPDVGRLLNSGRYSKIGWDRFGWELNVSGELLPVGETTIKAWIYDRNKKQFLKLDGTPKIKVIDN